MSQLQILSLKYSINENTQNAEANRLMYLSVIPRVRTRNIEHYKKESFF